MHCDPPGKYFLSSLRLLRSKVSSLQNLAIEIFFFQCKLFLEKAVFGGTNAEPWFLGFCTRNEADGYLNRSVVNNEFALNL